jgi:hypothetical protein
MANLTNAERDVIEALNEAMGLFEELRPEHDSDQDDFNAALRAAANIVLSRVGVRAQREQEDAIRPRRRTAVGFGSALDMPELEDDGDE